MEAKEFTLMQKLIDCTSNNLDSIFSAIAYYLLLNFNKIGSMSTATLASACFTSPSTVRRFCNSIGYSSFTDLRVAKSGNLEDQKQMALFNMHNGRFAAKYMQSHINEDIYAAARSIDRAMLDRLAGNILSKQNLLLVAIRPYALWLKEFQSQMLFIEKPTYIIDDLENYENLFESILESCSCIVVSPTAGIAGAIASRVGSLACEKTLIILKEYNNDDLLKGSLSLYDNVLQLNIPPRDISYLELYGKYSIGFLFDQLFGHVLSGMFPDPGHR